MVIYLISSNFYSNFILNKFLTLQYIFLSLKILEHFLKICSHEYFLLLMKLIILFIWEKKIKILSSFFFFTFCNSYYYFVYLISFWIVLTIFFNIFSIDCYIAISVNYCCFCNCRFSFQVNIRISLILLNINSYLA